MISNLENKIFDATVSTDVIIGPLLINKSAGYAYQIDYGAIIGTFTVQESISGEADAFLDAQDSSGNAISQAVSGPGKGIIQVGGSFGKWTQLKFTITSGSGNVKVWCEAKG